MKLIYINDELITGDGSNSHAVGMLGGFEKLLGKENVRSFPHAEDGSNKSINLKRNALKTKLRFFLQIVRVFRKKYLSYKRANEYIRCLDKENFMPTHIIARSTSFDITALLVAKHYKAKLIFEINTPMYYESIVIQKEPLGRALEKWEKQIISSSDNIYIVSKVCRNMLCHKYMCDSDKFFVIPNGYMEKLYHEDEVEKSAIRNRTRHLEGIETRFVVTFVGSLKAWHGVEELCLIAERLQQDKNIVFLVLGDGEMHDCVTNYVSTHSNMVFKGKVNLETMKYYLYASDLGIMPYQLKENFYYSPLKMFDMLGSGLPFIGTRIGQIEEFCLEKLNADFLVDQPTVDSYIQRIQMIKDNPVKLGDMADLVDSVRKYETWEKRCEMLIDSIAEIS